MARPTRGTLTRRRVSAGVAISCAVLVAPLGAQGKAVDSTPPPWTYNTQDASFRVEVVATGIQRPVALSFLPDGRLLVADRPIGQLSLLDVTTGALTPIAGVPPVHGKVDGGLLDVLVHPEYPRNGWIYFAYAAPGPDGNATVVDRARLRGASLVDRERVFSALPVVANSNEFGSRLVLDKGFLYVSVGQRNTPAFAQDLASHPGKIIRVRENGAVPDDNPFVHEQGAQPEIWCYGNRNPVGLALNPETGELWEHEHGPMGGDEVNIIRRGRNYGWPVISYGREYDGRPVGAGITHQDGMEQPIYYYNPDIAPSGMLFYSGNAFPAWRGNLFIGAMTRGHLNRLVIEHDRVLHEERLLEDRGWRVRAVQQGPDGMIYLGVDAGMIVRLRPVEPLPLRKP
jgi:glucose/arabinose dehydrogenase